MSVEVPFTLEGWEAHISMYSGPALRDKAKAANSTKFVQVLRSEGLSMEEIETILLYFARRMANLGMEPPSGGAFDLRNMILRDPQSPNDVLRGDFEEPEGDEEYVDPFEGVPTKDEMEEELEFGEDTPEEDAEEELGLTDLYEV